MVQYSGTLCVLQSNGPSAPLPLMLALKYLPRGCTRLMASAVLLLTRRLRGNHAAYPTFWCSGLRGIRPRCAATGLKTSNPAQRLFAVIWKVEIHIVGGVLNLSACVIRVAGAFVSAPKQKGSQDCRDGELTHGQPLSLVMRRNYCRRWENGLQSGPWQSHGRERFAGQRKFVAFPAGTYLTTNVASTQLWPAVSCLGTWA